MNTIRMKDKSRSKQRFLTALLIGAVCISAVTVLMSESSFGEMIAGSDFSDAATFNSAGGNYDIVFTDDLNDADAVTVTNWSFAGGGAFANLDANAQVGMPYDNVTKIDGDNASRPAVGTMPADLNEVSFSINIPAGTMVDLTSVSWDWRQATDGTANIRWLAFRTSLDDNLIFSAVGVHRNAFESETVILTGAQYENLTDQSVTFSWYAGGTGTGDIDIDTIIANGNVTQVPEPSSLVLAALGLFGLIAFSRRRRAV